MLTLLTVSASKSFMWVKVAINLILLPLKRELLSSKVCITGVLPAAPTVPGHHTRVRVPLLPRGRGRDHGGRHPRGAPAGVVHAAGLHRLLGPLRSVPYHLPSTLLCCIVFMLGFRTISIVSTYLETFQLCIFGLDRWLTIIASLLDLWFI